MENRSFSNDSTDSNHSIDPLVRALRLSFDNRTGAGFFLRAESFFNTATHIDRLDAEPGFGPPISLFYGGQSLHTRSHGETFFTVLELKFQRNGLFLLDEPEAALSPQRQLGLSSPDSRCAAQVQRRPVHHFNSLACLAWVSEAQIISVRWRVFAGDQIRRHRSNADRAPISQMTEKIFCRNCLKKRPTCSSGTSLLRTLSGPVSRRPSPSHPPKRQQICLSRHP